MSDKMKTTLNSQRCKHFLTSLRKLKMHMEDAERDASNALEPFMRQYGNEYVRAAGLPLTPESAKLERSDDDKTILQMTHMMDELNRFQTRADRLETYWERKLEQAKDEEYIVWNQNQNREGRV